MCRLARGFPREPSTADPRVPEFADADPGRRAACVGALAVAGRSRLYYSSPMPRNVTGRLGDRRAPQAGARWDGGPSPAPRSVRRMPSAAGSATAGPTTGTPAVPRGCDRGERRGLAVDGLADHHLDSVAVREPGPPDTSPGEPAAAHPRDAYSGSVVMRGPAGRGGDSRRRAGI